MSILERELPFPGFRQRSEGEALEPAMIAGFFLTDSEYGIPNDTTEINLGELSGYLTNLWRTLNEDLTVLDENRGRQIRDHAQVFYLSDSGEFVAGNMIKAQEGLDSKNNTVHKLGVKSAWGEGQRFAAAYAYAPRRVGNIFGNGQIIDEPARPGHVIKVLTGLPLEIVLNSKSWHIFARGEDTALLSDGEAMRRLLELNEYHAPNLQFTPEFPDLKDQPDYAGYGIYREYLSAFVEYFNIRHFELKPGEVIARETRIGV